MRVNIVLAGAALVIAPLACGRSESASAAADTAIAVATNTESSSDSAPTTAPPATIGADGSIAIHSSGNEMVLGLARDTVYMGLSDSLLAKTRAGMSRESSDWSGGGSGLANLIKSRVGDALGSRVRYPIADIQGVRYVNGAIEFDYRHKHAISFESVSTDHEKALASFTPDDSRRFVAAVNAALRADDSRQ